MPHAAGLPQTHRLHPCWPRDYSTRVLVGDVFQAPCVQQPPPFNTSEEVVLQGSGSPALCRALVSRLFSSPPCGFSRCSFDGVFQPPVAGNFIVSLGRGLGQLPQTRRPLLRDCALPSTCLPGLLSLLLHRGVPEVTAGAAAGNPAAAGGRGGDDLQPDLATGEGVSSQQGGPRAPGCHTLGSRRRGPHQGTWETPLGPTT